ncbi:UNVERIFIED_CONTAM: dockerin type I repeat protein [Acetivibrio alkalicellulosi]
MKKILSIALVKILVMYSILVIPMVLSSEDVYGQSVVFYEDFNNGLDGWTFSGTNNISSVSHELNSARIDLIDFGRAHLRKNITLTPGKAYVMEAQIKYSNIEATESDRGRYVGVNIAHYNTFNHSGFQSNVGSIHEWQTTTINFVAPQSGVVEIGLGIGYFSLRAKGTAWFNSISIYEDTSVTIIEGNHVYAVLHNDNINQSGISEEQLLNWVENLDKVYLKMYELVGMMPHNGNKLIILSSTQSKGYGLALVGNLGYIIWYQKYILERLERIVQFGDWSGAMMHEIGHVFNLGNKSWNWNDEIFADFRMYYALDQLHSESHNNPPIIHKGGNVYTGSHIKDYYDSKLINFLDNGKYPEAAVISILIRISENIGWQPFINTFTYLNTSNENYNTLNNYEKFINFLEILNLNTTQNVFEIITPVELNSIKASYLVPTDEVVLGDLNGDELIDSTDVILLRRYIFEILNFTDDRERKLFVTAADINGDGEVDSTDYILLKRFILEIPVNYPIGKIVKIY